MRWKNDSERASSSKKVKFIRDIKGTNKSIDESWEQSCRESSAFVSFVGERSRVIAERDERSRDATARLPVDVSQARASVACSDLYRQRTQNENPHTRERYKVTKKKRERTKWIRTWRSKVFCSHVSLLLLRFVFESLSLSSLARTESNLWHDVDIIYLTVYRGGYNESPASSCRVKWYVIHVCYLNESCLSALQRAALSWQSVACFAFKQISCVYNLLIPIVCLTVRRVCVFVTRFHLDRISFCSLTVTHTHLACFNQSRRERESLPAPRLSNLTAIIV
jgi:hypothetical protein